MAALLQTVVAEFIDGFVRAYGPFSIPVLLFTVGAVGYIVLVVLGRAGVEARHSKGEQMRPGTASETADDDERR
ncbi:hypothetical protein GL213_09995 [Halogeometricum borinquense]|uniref:Uncharacterized protein n=1 Tax=Halogeometricum borinquense TaxID=60847 RepID=A0A6C0UF46_9EURY|nr:hypothetical protein [Halogeometricum borinquense]QIB73827.1 hypothetical protein G3I44_05680 [Halogeometricum borinquense]QIQ76815.1 hypothetical protein GL213_09995 [Halogeometricum borinquense]